MLFIQLCFKRVSTHSRPKAAGYYNLIDQYYEEVSTHSRPKAAGWNHWPLPFGCRSFNSQPPEGGWGQMAQPLTANRKSFNSQPPEGGWLPYQGSKKKVAKFQLTAARRRLESMMCFLVTNKQFQLTAARRRLGRCPQIRS